MKTRLFRKIILFDALLLACLVLSTRLAAGIHEVLGHAAAAWLSGGRVAAIRLSLLGGGKVVGGPGTDSGPLVFLFAYSGILLNLATGAAALVLLSGARAGKRPAAELFWICFAMASVLGSLAYLVLGLYYGVGDPAAWSVSRPEKLAAWGLLLLALAPAASHACARPFFLFLCRAFPAENAAKRLGLAGATLFATGLVYAGLFLVSGQNLMSVAAPRVARDQDLARALAQKRTLLAEQIQRQHPDWTNKRILEELKKTPASVNERDVPKRFPLVPAVFAAYLAGGVAAAWRKNKAPRQEIELKEKSVALAVWLAALVLMALAFSGGVLRFPGAGGF